MPEGRGASKSPVLGTEAEKLIPTTVLWHHLPHLPRTSAALALSLLLRITLAGLTLLPLITQTRKGWAEGVDNLPEGDIES